MGTDWHIHLQNRLFQPVESVLRFMNRASTKNSNIPIWIVGAPRSGTTLIYQLMTYSFQSAYLTNRVASRYRIALLSRFWERNRASEPIHPQSFQSSYGNTTHPNDPHEGGQFFYQFFTNSENPEFRSDRHRQKFRNLIQALSQPEPLFISKNTIHSLRIHLLSSALPESKYVWVKRDPVAAAWSVYKKRKQMDGAWFGITPHGWQDQLKKPLEEQCLWQIQETNSIVEKQLKSAGHQYVELYYEDICENPLTALKLTGDELNISDHLKKPLALPDSFSVSEPPENDITRKLRAHLRTT